MKVCSRFRDLGHKNADADQVKAILAAEIIRRLTVTVSASAVRRAKRHCSSGLLSNQKCRPRWLHSRSFDVDHQSAWFKSGSENQSTTPGGSHTV